MGEKLVVARAGEPAAESDGPAFMSEGARQDLAERGWVRDFATGRYVVASPDGPRWAPPDWQPTP